MLRMDLFSVSHGPIFKPLGQLKTLIRMRFIEFDESTSRQVRWSVQAFEAVDHRNRTQNQ